MRGLVALLALAMALIVACGGDSAEPTGSSDTSSGAPASSTEEVEDVTVAALAFIDTQFGTTLAVSVEENDAGLQWVDAVLDESGDIRSLIAHTDDGPVHWTFEGDSFVISAPGGDFALIGTLDGDELTLISDGETTVHPVDFSSSTRRLDDGAGWMRTNYVPSWTPRPTGDRQQSAPNPLEYMVNRPTSINAEAIAEVTIDGEDGPFDPASATVAFALTVQCAADESGLDALVYGCRPQGDDAVVVSAELPLPTPEDWDGRNQVFASGERCEAWASYVAKHRTFWSGLGLASPVALAEPWSKIVKVTAGAMGFIFNRSASVPCGTITVADEYVEEQMEARAGFAIDVDVSAVAFEWTFSTDSHVLHPFAPGPSTPFHLVATPLEDERASTDEDGDRDAAEDRDGVYFGTTHLYQPEEADGEVVVRDEVELIVDNGRVVNFSGGVEVRDMISERGAGQILCRSDLTVEFELMEPIALDGGVAEAAVELHTLQSVGRRTPALSPSSECDPDLAGDERVPLRGRFTIADGEATVEVLLDGEVIMAIQLARR